MGINGLLVVEEVGFAATFNPVKNVKNGIHSRKAADSPCVAIFGNVLEQRLWVSLDQKI
jgi:hypothetical protein